MRNIDFVLGSQYGDEGKGMVAKLIADKAAELGNPYAWTGRVGAQNAEHRFVHDSVPFTGRVFPSAAADRDIIAILGAGHCFRPEHFHREAVHLRVRNIDRDHVKVDPHAMWLKDHHAEINLATGNSRATTGWGVGAAVAEKVRRQHGTQLIGSCPEMEPFLEDIPVWLDQNQNLSGLMEGSQGAMLSLDHGHFPYSTAKNVSATAAASEMGFSHKRINKVFGVARLVFMRVPGPSGPTGGQEVSYDQVEERTGLRLPHHQRLQGDTSRWTAGMSPDKADEERLFDFSMWELKKSHALNGYDGIAITFVDYHRKDNYAAKKWSDLHKDTKNLIEQISREVAPVFLVRTGQGEHDNIWLCNPWDIR
jgi:adenylosuccinate synthase